MQDCGSRVHRDKPDDTYQRDALITSHAAQNAPRVAPHNRHGVNHGTARRFTCAICELPQIAVVFSSLPMRARAHR